MYTRAKQLSFLENLFQKIWIHFLLILIFLSPMNFIDVHIHHVPAWKDHGTIFAFIFKSSWEMNTLNMIHGVNFLPIHFSTNSTLVLSFTCTIFHLFDTLLEHGSVPWNFNLFKRVTFPYKASHIFSCLLQGAGGNFYSL